ncbi:MAG: hypothetical protein H0X67_00765 [Acidobacteria bacterium]|nr:hypothetical protein [Acidobacteriota bacterium]
MSLANQTSIWDIAGGTTSQATQMAEATLSLVPLAPDSACRADLVVEIAEAMVSNVPRRTNSAWLSTMPFGRGTRSALVRPAARD